MKIYTRLKEINIIPFVVLFLFVSASQLTAQTAVTSSVTSTVTATAGQYDENGNTHFWGQGNDLFLESVTVGTETYFLDNGFTQTNYIIRRVNGNGGISYDRCGLMVEENTGDFNYEATFPGTINTATNTTVCSMELVLKEPIINRGANDVFKNNGGSTSQNIERIDVLYDPFLIPNTAVLNRVGFLASEKAGNSSYKLAVVTSIDASGDPLTYGSIVTIVAADYGLITGNLEFSWLVDNPPGDPNPVRVGGNGGNEAVGVTYISLVDLGIAVNDTVYGISFFDSNVPNNADLLDLTDTNDFPSATGGGADILGGLGSIVTSLATINGHLYEDTNANGVQETGEPNLAGVDILITASDASTQTVTTDALGNYSAFVPGGNTTADIILSDPDLPPNFVQTEGNNPTSVNALEGQPNSIGIDGFAPDSDGDGVLDANDICNGFDDIVDTDGDTVPNGCDLDNDNDGILDTDENASCGIVNSTLLFQDFGAAASATPSSSVTLASLNPGITTAYGYDALSNPYAANDLDDDFYSVFNNIPESAVWAGNAWQSIGDHTGGSSIPTADRMLMVNAGNTLDVVYQQTLTGVGTGALIDVSLWILNLDVDQPSNDGRDLPNLQIELWQNGAILGAGVNTGDIPRETKGDINSWKKFTTPTSLKALDNSDVTLIIRNNVSATNGNDLAIDDILVTQNCDTDGDLIPDYLDTDSDQDGCPDAIEGAGTFVASDLTTSDNLADADEGQVDANGVPEDISAASQQQATTTAVTNDLDATACVAPEADLSLTKTIDNATPSVGQTVIFSITISNAGPSDATGVQVRDMLPSGMTYDVASSTIPASTTFNVVSGIWDLSGVTIVNGTSYTLEIAAVISPACGNITNVAEIISSDLLDPDSTIDNGN